jgi:SH3-like domain-containing protein
MTARRAARSLRALGLALAMLGLAQMAAAQDGPSPAPSVESSAVAPDVPGTRRSTGLPVPRFVSLGADRVHLRFGPGKEYPISWVLARKGLPVEIVAEFDTWRKVRLHDGDEGWIHSSLLSSQRTVMIKDAVAELRRTPGDDGRVVLRAEPGVIGELLDCAPDWCRVDIGGRRGWLPRHAFWGTLPEEIVG